MLFKWSIVIYDIIVDGTVTNETLIYTCLFLLNLPNGIFLEHRKGLFFKVIQQMDLFCSRPKDCSCQKEIFTKFNAPWKKVSA